MTALHTSFIGSIHREKAGVVSVGMFDDSPGHNAPFPAVLMPQSQYKPVKRPFYHRQGWSSSGTS